MCIELVDRPMSQAGDQQTMGRTSIQVSDELADYLHNKKDRGESYEDVIWSLVEKAEGGDVGSDKLDEGTKRGVDDD